MSKGKSDLTEKRRQQQIAIEALRRNQRRLLDHPGVTSVGVGYRIKDGKPTSEIVIQCTVEQKLAPEELVSAHRQPLPESVPTADGSQVPVDIVQRSYRASFFVEADAAQTVAEDFHSTRRSICDPMVPGVSVCNVHGTAGTIGAFVYDQVTGEPLLLSNWHVLHGPEGSIGDPIVQPGPYDDPVIDGNGCGSLLRSFLGMAGDCAVARIEGRSWEQTVLELERTPRRMADPELDDHVVKSGRTTGVTYGVVSRMDVVVKINYGGDVGVQEVGGFEIRPNPTKPSANGEISQGGDSGSAWMVDVEPNDPNADIMLGLHFAGEVDPDPSAEHAVACKITSVAEKLKIRLAPAPEHQVAEESLWQEVWERLRRLEDVAANAANQTCKCQASSQAKSSNNGASNMGAAEASLPIYGNWCGPGHGGGPTVDALDAACKKHDECYDRRGYFDCDCDKSLTREVDTLITSRRLTGRARAAALAVRAYFSVSPCVRHARIGNRNVPIPLPPLPDVGGAIRNAGRRLGGALGF